MMPSDEDLIDRFYAGDDDAFTELEARYTPRLNRFFWKLGIRPLEDCEDLTQETWQRVARTRYQPLTRFDRNRMRSAPWLFAIAHNIARDCWRRRRARPQTVPPPQTKGADDWDTLGSVDPQLYEDLHDCIERLGEPWRTVITLRRAGLTLEEVASAMGVVVSTAKERESRAMARLRACLEGKGHTVRVSPAEAEEAKKAAAGGVETKGRKD